MFLYPYSPLTKYDPHFGQVIDLHGTPGCFSTLYPQFGHTQYLGGPPYPPLPIPLLPYPPLKPPLLIISHTIIIVLRRDTSIV